ncbi:MAG: STAS domain-containing protein [Candidatus Ozemobacteraceae bacterium]
MISKTTVTFSMKTRKPGPSEVELILSGAVDEVNIGGLENEIAGLIEGGMARITIDLSGVTFLSSGVLRIIIQYSRTLKQRNGELVLANPQAMVLKVLRMTRIDQIVRLIGVPDEKTKE